MAVPHGPIHRIVNIHWEGEEDDGDDFDVDYKSSDGGLVSSSSQSQGCTGPVGGPQGVAGYFSVLNAQVGFADGTAPLTIQRVGSSIGKNGTLSGAPFDQQTLSPAAFQYGGTLAIDPSISGTTATVRARVNTLGPTACRGPVGAVNFIMAPIQGTATPVTASVDWSVASFVSDDDPPRTYKPVRLESLQIVGVQVSYFVIWRRVS